jgi:glycerol-3-phosphate O-acyltransferase
MRPLTFYETPFIERCLIVLHPLWAWCARHFPKLFAVPEPAPPHPSAMLTKHNAMYRMLFPRFFARISVDDAAVDRLRSDAQVATIVYVARWIGQLEYHYFNHLFLARGLPLARYTNALTLHRWMPLAQAWRSVAAQEREIGECGRPLDPITDGFLARMIGGGESALLTISPSDIDEKGFLFTAPLRALAAIIEAQRGSGQPIALVPLDFLWSQRPPHAKRSLVDILFGESESPGRLRKFFLFWRNYKLRAQAFIGSPIDVQEFLREHPGEGDEALAQKLGALFLTKLHAQKRTITGPPLRPRSWYIREILSDDALDGAICRMAAERGKPADDMRELALRYVKEIVSDLDYAYIEILERLVGPRLLRLFDTLDVDREGLARARTCFEKGSVIFVPNHKSHTDYLLLSHILYHQHMALPLIAAGANLSFWPMGNIFRHCGAYFIRRTFHGNRLYRDVLKTYLKVLLKEGHAQEFFLEGGRSRTGKLLQPKLGLLGIYREAAAEAGIEQLTFIPVTITYDRVIEYRSYVRELEGERKEKEHTTQLLRLMKFLRMPQKLYGSIYVRFGQPLTAPAASADPLAVEAAAHRICMEINRRAVATPAAIAAGALLCAARGGITETEFLRNAEAIIGYLASKGVEIPEPLHASPQLLLQQAIAQFAAQRLVTARHEALEPFIAVEESKRIPLSYFRNSIAHFFISAAVTASLLSWHARQGREPTIDEITADIEGCQRLLLHEYRFATRPPARDHVANAIEFLHSYGAVEFRDDGRVVLKLAGAWLCELFTSQMRPCVETLWIAARYVEEKLRSGQDERALIGEMLRTGQDLFTLGRIRYREAITRDGFANALLTLVDFGVLVREKTEEKQSARYSSTGDAGALTKLKVELEKVI